MFIQVYWCVPIKTIFFLNTSAGTLQPAQKEEQYMCGIYTISATIQFEIFLLAG